MKSATCILMIAVLAAPIAFGAESTTTVSYQSAKEIFQKGEQDHCSEGHYKARKEDKWLALIQTDHEYAIVAAYVDEHGLVTAQAGMPLFFLKQDAVPIKAARVASATVRQPKSETRVVYFFGKTQWRLIERGGSDITFYISDGTTQWSYAGPPIPYSLVRNGVLLTITKTGSSDVSISDENQMSFNEQLEERDGQSSLAWAGDLTNDGLLDFIVSVRDKETWGHQLWIGERSPAGELQFRLMASARDGCS